MPFRFEADFRPRVLALERQLASRSGADGARRRGERGDPWGHRPFVEGDDQRRIDWNVLARLDELHVRQPGSGDAPELLLLLDRSGSMDDALGGKDRMQRELCVALGWLGLAAGGIVQLALTGEGGPVTLGRWQGARRFEQLLQVVENLPVPTGPTALAAIATLRAAPHRIAALLTDGLVEPLPAAAVAALARAGGASLFLLSAAYERRLPEGASHCLGGEGERACAVDDGASRQSAWTAALAAHETEWRRICHAHGVRMTPADDSRPFEETLLHWCGPGGGA